MKRLPPLNALNVFWVASKEESFANAADTLCLTRSAVSRQIKLLEDNLGVKLFDRTTHSLVMTPEGKFFSQKIDDLFNQLYKYSSEIKFRNEKSLNISVSTPFYTTWLKSQLDEFLKLNNEYVIKIEAIDFDSPDTPLEFSPESYLAAFRLGSGQWPGTTSHLITEVEIVLMCSPKLLPQGKKLSSLEELQEYNWIGWTEASDYWERWLDSVDAKGLQTNKQHLIFDNLTVATMAMIEGEGIFTACRPHASGLEEMGIITPAHDKTVMLDESYYFVYPEELDESTIIQGITSFLKPSK